MNFKIIFIIISLGVIMAALFYIASGMAHERKDVVIEMTNDLRFQPSSITISVSDTVRWKNSSLLVHTVTADPGLAANKEDVNLPDGAKAFNSGNLDPEKEFEHKFKVPGQYKYFCIPHEGAGMTGEVVVK